MSERLSCSVDLHHYQAQAEQHEYNIIGSIW